MYAAIILYLIVFECVLLKGPVAGYRSILRTFISAFIASYEINIQVIILFIKGVVVWISGCWRHVVQELK